MFKKSLYILLPIIILVLFLIFVSYILSQSKINEDITTFSDSKPISTNKITQYNAFKNTQLQKNTEPLKNKSLSDWQQSPNIKYQVKAPLLDKKDSQTKTLQDSQNYPDEDSPQLEQIESEPSFFTDLISWMPTKFNNNPTKPQNKTALEQEIYDYGNNIGKLIKDFSNTSGNHNKLMSDFVKDTHSANNILKLESLAENYKLLAKQIKNTNAPIPMKAVADNLSLGYASVGEATLQLSKQRTDEELLKEIYKYNKTVEDFAISFIKFSKIFRLYGIRYNKGEPGDIFMPALY